MQILIAMVEMASNILFVLLVARVLLPMLGADPNKPLLQAVLRLTEPILAPIRALIPLAGGLDFSPMVAMVLLAIVQTAVILLLGG
jgi:YggT family protein